MRDDRAAARADPGAVGRMLGLETLSGPARAGGMVGLVLVESVVLYVGYGALVGRVGRRVTDALRGD